MKAFMKKLFSLKNQITVTATLFVASIVCLSTGYAPVGAAIGLAAIFAALWTVGTAEKEGAL